MMSQTWKVVRPHLPLIRFRKGVSDTPKDHKTSPSASSLSGKQSISAAPRPVIEDYQLPLRYRRQVLDEKEIDAINSGGAY